MFLVYLRWHYTRALANYWRLARDWLWFITHFFSLKILLRTWAAPWRRLGEKYPAHFHPGDFLAALLVNFLMRVVGVFIRTLVLIFGALVWLMVLIVSLLGWVIWLALPILILMFAVIGLRLLLWP